MDKYAVIGNPIAHSLSPEIHGAFAHRTHQEMSYEKLLASVDGFVESVTTFFDSGAKGLNVTAPFKNDAYQFVDERDQSAVASEAVNTIRYQGGTSTGFNTDGAGLLNDLKRLRWKLADARILIIGAGGATQGILQSIVSAGGAVSITNRTLARAERLQQRFPSVGVLEISDCVQSWDVIINATSAFRNEERLPVPPELFRDAAVYDLGYSRTGATPFLDFASEFAQELSDGLGMLVEQAAEAFGIWRGIRPETDSILAELRTPRRQFIAGAQCDKCGEIDRIYIEKDLLGHVVRRSCVACGATLTADGATNLAIKSSR